MALPRYSRKSKLSPSELRTFRSAVASLKKQGLIKGKVDARTAQPFFLRGGKTLAEQVNAASKKVVLPSVLKPANKLFTLRNLPGKKYKSLAQLVKDIEENGASFDKLKHRDEKWAFQINGSNSLKTYENIDQLLEMFHYPRDNPFTGIRHTSTPENSEFIFDNLKLVRWTKTNREWAASAPIKKKKRVRKRRK